MPNSSKWIDKANLSRFWDSIKHRFTIYEEQTTELMSNEAAFEKSIKTRVEANEAAMPTLASSAATSALETKFGEDIADDVSDWLGEHVDPVGSAVVVDDTLTISGAAADAKAAGDRIGDLKSALTNGIHKLANDYIEVIYPTIENGTIDANGENSATPSGYIRTVGYIKKDDIELFNVESHTGGFYVERYNYSNGSYTFLGENQRTGTGDYTSWAKALVGTHFRFLWNGLLSDFYHWFTLAVKTNLKEKIFELNEAEIGLAELQNSMFPLGYFAKEFSVETSGHSSTDDQIPVQIKTKTKFRTQIISTVVTGYQLYAYYSDGTNARIYSGTTMDNTYTAAKDIVKFGLYISSSFITASGVVRVLTTLIDEFYEETTNITKRTEMIADQYGEITSHYNITANTAINGAGHETQCNIKSGEAFSIQIRTKPYGAITGVQYYAVYSDGTDERIYSSSYYYKYVGLAKKNIVAIRLVAGAVGVIYTGTCDVIIKSLENTLALQISSELSKGSMVKSINHRGYVTAPENTIPAYKLSYKAGFKYVETDVQLTSDGVPILLHDGTINRTARNADGTELPSDVYISNITYEQALTYDFGIYKGTEFEGTKIPLFSDFIVLCKRLSLHPYIEIKPSGFTEAQVQNLVNIVGNNRMLNNVTWMSQNHAYLAYVSTYSPNARIGLVVVYVTSDNAELAASLKTETNSVFIASGSATDNDVNLCKSAGLPMAYWTANSISEFLTTNQYVDEFITDSINGTEVLIEKALS